MGLEDRNAFQRTEWGGAIQMLTVIVLLHPPGTDTAVPDLIS